MNDEFVCFLFDNGSFRADSTRSLRTLAANLAKPLGHPVRAVSLLHSSRVSPAELDGEPAKLLEPELQSWFALHPRGRALLLPLFFGPSGALVDYVPERLAALHTKYPEGRVKLAEALVLPHEEPSELVAILADRVRATMQARGWNRPNVILCDHGTPLRTVSEIRDRLAAGLARALAGEVGRVAPASMERRPEEAFAFNEPLLETLLATPPFNGSHVVVALQFLSPGRHAGPGGDVAQICATAEAAAPGLSTAMSTPIADDPRLIDVLTRRAKAVLF